jgi:hypothetical protein
MNNLSLSLVEEILRVLNKGEILGRHTVVAYWLVHMEFCICWSFVRVI